MISEIVKTMPRSSIPRRHGDDRGRLDTRRPPNSTKPVNVNQASSIGQKTKHEIHLRTTQIGERVKVVTYGT